MRLLWSKNSNATRRSSLLLGVRAMTRLLLKRNLADIVRRLISAESAVNRPRANALEIIKRIARIAIVIVVKRNKR